VIIGFIGVILMIGPSALSGLETDVLAQIAVLGAAVSYAFAGVFGRRFKAMGIEVITSIIGLAILSTAVAYILYFRILASAGATNLLLVTFLIPISAILLGSLVLGESLELIHYLGMALIGFGLSAIDGRLWRRKRRLESPAE